MSDRLITDIGGFEDGDIPRDERPPVFWERQMIATQNLLRARKHMNLDEIRRKVEEMDPETYKGLSFYGRRTEAVIGLLVEKNVIDADEIDSRTDEILRRNTRDHAC
jgi:hypothetical protein